MTAYSPMSKRTPRRDAIRLALSRASNHHHHSNNNNNHSPSRPHRSPRRPYQRRHLTVDSTSLNPAFDDDDHDSDNTSEVNTHLLNPAGSTNMGSTHIGSTLMGSTHGVIACVATDPEVTPTGSPARMDTTHSSTMEFSFLHSESEHHGGGSHDVEKQACSNDAAKQTIQAGMRRNLNSLPLTYGSRLTEARLSLLGKPLSYKAHRRDIRFRRFQARVYNFLERPKLWRSWTYHFAV
ncbi:hypothetical protein ACOMHN_034840 [Nucella lapillus]